MAFSAVPQAQNMAFTGPNTLANVNDAQRIKEVSTKLVWYKRNDYPLLWWLVRSLPKIMIEDPEPRVFYIDEPPRNVAVTNNATSDTYEYDTFGVADADAQFLKVGEWLLVDGVYCNNAGDAFSTTAFDSGYVNENTRIEEIELSGIASGTARVKVRRGNGKSAAASGAGTVTQLTTSHKLILMGDALHDQQNFGEGGGILPGYDDNFAQWFNTTASEDMVMKNTALKGKVTIEMLRQMKRDQLLRDAEVAVIWGQKGSSLVNGSKRRKMGGILEKLPTASTARDEKSRFIDFGGAFDPTILRAHAEYIFRYGGTIKRMFIGPTFFTELLNYYNNKLIYNDKVSKVEDIMVHEIETGHGVFELVRLPALNSVHGDTSTNAIVLDPEYIKLAFMKNMDLQIRRNIQANNATVTSDTFFAMWSLIRHLPEAHAMIYGIDKTVSV